MHRRRRQTGKIVGLGLLAALLFILMGIAGWILCFGMGRYTAKEIASEAIADAGYNFRIDGTAKPQDDGPRFRIDDAAAQNGQKADRTDQENADMDGADTDRANGASDSGEEENSDIVLLFGGDVYLSNHVLNAYEKAGGIHGVLDEKIRKEIGDADLFVVNQEFPFTDRGKPAADKQFTFRLPPARVSLLKEMGIDIVTLANNHILDYGPVGITDSLAALDQAGILHVGAGENLEQAKKLETVRIKDRVIGFLGVSRVYMDGSWAAGNNHPGVFSTYDSKQAVAEIKAAREQCDYLVVYVHWGVEKETVPKDYQHIMGREYIDAGADLVVGSHPHVLQEIEYYKEKPIVHSLGNFVFGSSIPETELLKVTLTEEGAAVITLPCTSSGGYTRMR